MCLSAWADTRHLPGQSRLSTQAAVCKRDMQSYQITIYQHTHTHTFLGTPTDNRGEQTSEVPWELSTAGSPRVSEYLDASSGPAQAMPCLACHSSCCWLTENRGQCGDQGYWSSSEGLTQSCLLPQRCGSGTLHRWKTEEGEWVIMRVLAPFCPHTQKKSSAHNYGPLTSLSCVVFWDCHRRVSAMRNTDGEEEEREIQKAGPVPTGFE